MFEHVIHKTSHAKSIVTISILLSLFLLTKTGFGQVQILLKPSNPFHFTPESSWEMDIVSMFDKSFRVRAKVRIYHVSIQTPLVELQSEILEINPGLNSFNELTTGTQKILYKNVEIGDFVQAVGKFPSGDYKVCVIIECITQNCDGAGQIHFETPPCKDVKVELPTPLLLTFPFNKSVIEEKRPLFSWIPPMPIGGQLQLRYVFTLTEKRMGQSHIDAIKRNRPIIQDRYVELTSMSYPIDMDELEYEKDYVWQVEAWYGNLYIATSEVWEFKLEEEEEEEEIIIYTKVDATSHGVIHTDKFLYFSYFSQSTSSNLKYEIFDNQENKINDLPQLEKKYGENQYELNLIELNIKSEEIHTLIITNENGVKNRIKFKLSVTKVIKN